MVRKPRKGQPRGRSGGRAGGAGYDFQDTYIALQLAKLLVGDRERPVEVLWEKKAVDWGSGAETLHVDDVIIDGANGKRIYVQVKETAPSREWSTAELLRSGVLTQFWEEWRAKSPEVRETTVLRLASGGSVMPLSLLVDVARRARTPSELLSDEASAEVVEDIRAISKALSLDPTDLTLLDFIKSIEAEQLPAAKELEGWILKCLVAAGENAVDLSNRLVRLVSQSKHAGPAARSSYTRGSLLEALRGDGVADDTLIAIGVVRAKPLTDSALWDRYRERVVEDFRSFRVYGLQVERAVYADLPALFVPLRLAALDPERPTHTRDSDERQRRRSLTEIILAEWEEVDDRYEGHRRSEKETDLARVMTEKRRIAIVGGPGTGKTTTLRWLAIISALPGIEGRQTRSRFGLPAEPLVPVYVRFRQFAERFQQRGFHGVEGRVGLVADFLAAQFEGGLVGTAPTRTEALQIAQEILESESSILLFDGLDEVADETIRNRLFQAVADLIQKYKAPRVIVCSRPYAFQSERSPLELSLFEPLPLDRSGRRTFARQWYRSVRSHLGTVMPEAQAETLADDLAKTAETLPDLAEVPLLFSILALVHFNRQGLPVERAMLYDYATLAMLGHWERDRSGRDLGDDAIPADWSRKLELNETGIRRVVECLAHDVQCGESGGEFDQSSAITALSEGLLSAATRSHYGAAERAALLLRLLADRSGLVQERNPGVFAFIHLSFQEYLTARWFVGRGEIGLGELAALASDDRHAEVIRLAVAILASDQRAEADERARWFIGEVARRNAVIAAACLIEVPRLQLEPNVAETFARAVWSECSQMFRRHYHPRLTSRLIWTLLPQTTNADRLLLEFLSDSGEDHFHQRGMMEFETGLFLLQSRPPGSASPELEWVLHRLANAKSNRHRTPFRLSALGSLLLVEAAALSAADALDPLIDVLGSNDWSRNKPGEAPSERAQRLLSSVLQKQETREPALIALRNRLSDDGEESRWRIGQLLLSYGEPISETLANALVQGGLSSRSRHDEACTLLESLTDKPAARQVVLKALAIGLSSGDQDIRKGCLRVLRVVGASIPASAQHPDQEEDDRVAHLCALLSNPETASSTLALLADQLWDEDRDISWHAARALIDSGHIDTPGTPQAVVRAGLGSEAWRSMASQILKQSRVDTRLDLAVRAALLDGLLSESDRVASASALLLLEMDDVKGGARLVRVVKASLRDPSQISELLPDLRRLAGNPDTRSLVLKSIGEYLGGKSNEQVASKVSQMLADAGHLETSNLALGLVHGGLSDSSAHRAVIDALHRMLEDTRFVTDTRRALAKGLSSSDNRVAWGAARCLWEAGSRSDPELPGALVRGLADEGKKEEAQTWLLELLAIPATRKKARSALEYAAYRALHSGSSYNNDYDLAWRIGLCFAAAGMFSAQNFTDSIVYGGLSRRDRHAVAIPMIEQLWTDPNIAEDLEEKLGEALGSSEHDIAWGAARVIVETGCGQVGKLFKDSDRPHDRFEPNLDDDDDDDEQVKREVLLIRVLLRESQKDALAAEALRKFAEHVQAHRAPSKALIKLLEDEDGSIAYTAARWLLSVGKLEHSALAVAIVTGGLSDRSLFGKAVNTLDQLRSDPAMSPAVTEALNRALWGTNAGAAWGAAIYLMDRGESSNTGIARGVVFGGMLHERHQAEVSDRLAVLLADPKSRNAALDALGAALYGEHRGERFHVASLLMRAGAELNDRIVGELAESSRYWPAAPLSLLALSGRASEARDIAMRLNLTGFVELIGDEFVHKQPISKKA
jgi:hypothetical protein